jgi:hypothetical protein
MPSNVEEALLLDNESGDTLWYDTTVKEMENVRISFEAKKDGNTPLGINQQSLC